MKRFSVIIPLLFLTPFQFPLAADTAAYTRCWLSGGRAVCEASGAEKDIDDCVLTATSGESFYYYKIHDGRPVLGSVDRETGERRLLPLPDELAGRNPVKMMVQQDSLYLLTGPAGDLLKVPLRGGDIVTIENVSDFVLLNGIPAVLRPDGSGGRVVQCNGVTVPVSLQGESRLGEVVAERLIFVSDGDDTEIVDILAGKSVYLFSATREFLEPGEYNFTFDAADSPKDGTASQDMIFYKVYIDGEYAGRTETGLASLKASYTHAVVPDRYHIVRAERWELDKKASEYRRANNIRQPDEVRLFFPAKRIMSLDLVFDGEKYSITRRPLYR